MTLNAVSIRMKAVMIMTADREGFTPSLFYPIGRKKNSTRVEYQRYYTTSGRSASIGKVNNSFSFLLGKLPLDKKRFIA